MLREKPRSYDGRLLAARRAGFPSLNPAHGKINAAAGRRTTFAVGGFLSTERAGVAYALTGYIDAFRFQ